MGTIFSALFDSILQAAINYLNGIQEKRALIKQGMNAQAAAETASTARIEAAEAQAEADTDRTAAGMIKAAQEGKF